MKAVFLDFDTLGPTDIDISPLTDQLPGLELFPTTAQNELAERVSDVEVIIINKVRLNDAVLRSARRLKLICLVATGTDNVTLSSAGELGIAVCNIRDYCTPSVAQHVFSLILSLTHHLREYEILLRERAWMNSPQFCLLDFPIRELEGKTLGIVGFGSLGSRVAKIAAAFGMSVLAARRPYSQVMFDDTLCVDEIERVSLNDLLIQSDVVSLHCPLNLETEDLINANTLRTMRDDAILINTARGGLIDSAALVAALQTGQIAGAGIDVLRQEPPVEADAILDADLPNLIVTPHIAWAARESRQRAVNEIAANIGAYLNGKRRNRVV
jgi:glycerate dehydrogenase